MRLLRILLVDVILVSWTSSGFQFGLFPRLLFGDRNAIYGVRSSF